MRKNALEQNGTDLDAANARHEVPMSLWVEVGVRDSIARIEACAEKRRHFNTYLIAIHYSGTLLSDRKSDDSFAAASSHYDFLRLRRPWGATLSWHIADCL